MTRTIEVLISPNGETKLETKGFSGAGCQAASEFLEAVLGRKTRDERTAPPSGDRLSESATRDWRYSP